METDKDENAMLMYHRIGTSQGERSYTVHLQSAEMEVSKG